MDGLTGLHCVAERLGKCFTDFPESQFSAVFGHFQRYNKRRDRYNVDLSLNGALYFEKKHTNYLVSFYYFHCYSFFCLSIIRLSFKLNSAYFSGRAKMYLYKTYQCKVSLIVPEEGWFGQPK